MKVLGIDIGGSGIKGAPIDINTGTLLEERHRIETPQPATPEAVAKVVSQLIKHFNWKGKVGVGFPAAIQQGIVKTASNIDNSWIDTPIDKFLSKKTGCEVFSANDADMAGLAELNFGVGKNKKGVVVLITVGTGIGSVLFVDGKLMPNSELGHMQFKDISIEKHCSDATRKFLDLSWKKWAGRFSESLKYFESLFYPDLFIVGGGGSKKFDKYKDYLNIETPIIPAKLLNNAGIIGAAVYAAKK